MNSRYDDLLGAYLAQRRGAGFQLARAEKLLTQFGSWLDAQAADGRAGTLFTGAQAAIWAGLPARSALWREQRLGAVRSFARWLAARGEPVEIPAGRAVSRTCRRAIPYQYTEADITALMAACDDLFTGYRAATMATLIGVLAVTGMRIGEAINLDRADIDADQATLRIRRAKNGQDRLVVLADSSLAAIRSYVDSPARPATTTDALLVSLAGTRLLYCNIQEGFSRLVTACGLEPRPGARPRIHDLRHRFATITLAGAYQPGSPISPERAATLLSRWLGHTNPADTYWYLEASPALTRLAAARLEGAQP